MATLTKYICDLCGLPAERQGSAPLVLGTFPIPGLWGKTPAERMAVKASGSNPHFADLDLTISISITRRLKEVDSDDLHKRPAAVVDLCDHCRARVMDIALADSAPLLDEEAGSGRHVEYCPCRACYTAALSRDLDVPNEFDTVARVMEIGAAAEAAASAQPLPRIVATDDAPF